MSDVLDVQVTATPQEKAWYEQMIGKITAVDHCSPPSMSLGEAVAEGKRSGVLVKEDDAKLRPTGIDPKYLDSIESRAGAFAWAAAQVQTNFDTGSTAAKEWKDLMPEAEAVRKRLFKDMERAFRNDPQLIKGLNAIRAGQGYKDRVMDFLALHKIGSDNIELLGAIGADVTNVEKAAILHTKTSNILARMTIDPEKQKTAQVIYNKAWTYLKEALDEIYAAGQYAFDEEDPRHQAYYCDYYVRLGQAAAKTVRDKKEAHALEPSIAN